MLQRSRMWIWKSTIILNSILHMFFRVIRNILICILLYMCSDKLIEESAGGTPVAQIFKGKNEEYFRDSEVMPISLHHILLQPTSTWFKEGNQNDFHCMLPLLSMNSFYGYFIIYEFHCSLILKTLNWLHLGKHVFYVDKGLE